MATSSTPNQPEWAARLHGSQLAPLKVATDPIAELVISSHYLLLEEILRIQQHLGMDVLTEDLVIPHG